MYWLCLHSVSVNILLLEPFIMDAISRLWLNHVMLAVYIVKTHYFYDLSNRLLLVTSVNNNHIVISRCILLRSNFMSKKSTYGQKAQKHSPAQGKQ
ncbi:hypothetical protein Ahy_A02g006769 isoform B [Arachis hypogaea]|uniref:Uncharacterized protein n=1 Tax=Arachis hypogaea TaxID=3818 RepID=A0A445EB57_ARAHY|nr:hypothetical protein Ahy_A02g006769 isoform B [Arachis hypogaea]